MIEITGSKVEDHLKDLLQSTVQFRLNNKIWRRGKILLFNQKGFNIEFLILYKDKKSRFEIPIPFEACSKEKSLFLSYKFNDLSGGDKKITEMLHSLSFISKSKFYDNTLELREINGQYTR
jgi:hypothetical protein